MSDSQLSSSENYEFRLDEMAWFNKDGRMNGTLTALSTLENDEDFETWLTVIRAARSLAKGSRVIAEEGRSHH